MADVKLARTTIKQLVEEAEITLNMIRTDLLARETDEVLLKEILMSWSLLMRRSMRTYRKAYDALGGAPCTGDGPCPLDGE
jgi:hypothetical protein